MKNVILFFLIIFVFIFSPKISGAMSENADFEGTSKPSINSTLLEKIDDFDVIIKLNSDASLEISERIAYDFGASESKHGIYREIPIKYKARGGNYNLRINGISVVDENGRGYKFTKSFAGDYIRIKIGDADEIIKGKRVYIINYKINRAINYFDSYDELYWNVTGSRWKINIDRSSATIILPKSMPENELKKTCFAGRYGSNESCLKSEYIDDGGMVNEIKFNQDYLAANEGLTVVFGFPKGSVKQPSAFESFRETVMDNWVIFIPFITFFAMSYLWYAKGRDPKGRGTIVAQFDAPDGLTPAEVGTIIDEKAENRDVTANIINLAVRGYIKINRTEKKRLFNNSGDYILEKLKSESDLESFDRKLMVGLFDSKNSIKLSELKQRFFEHMKNIKEELYNSTVAKGYFPKDPNRVRANYLIAAAIFVFLGFLIMPTMQSAIALVCFMISGIIIAVIGPAMPIKTKKGAEAREYILGLKKYMEVAEKDRIDFHNAPEKNPKQFEKLLPFAMVLGVEKKWAKQFERIYDAQPSWYSDPSGARFSSFVLISSLNNFSHSANSTLSALPASASGGGSGFSGGGFSGGGFGGGGGGSW